jgi:hypothetical protein
MKLTKLQLVQRVLNAIDSDDVSEISETVESEQVAMLVDAAYDMILSDFPWPHLRDLRQLEVTTVANEMRIPDRVMTVNSIKYNKLAIEYIDPMDMQDLLDSRDLSLDDTDSVGAYNDRDPIQWSSYDDETVIFDAYNGTLASSLTSVDTYKTPTPMVLDTEYPDLPERFHPILADQSTADAFFNLKGDITGYNIYRKRTKLGMINMQRWAKKVNQQQSTGFTVNYSRKKLS